MRWLLCPERVRLAILIRQPLRFEPDPDLLRKGATLNRSVDLTTSRPRLVVSTLPIARSIQLQISLSAPLPHRHGRQSRGLVPGWSRHSGSLPDLLLLCSNPPQHTVLLDLVTLFQGMSVACRPRAPDRAIDSFPLYGSEAAYSLDSPDLTSVLLSVPQDRKYLLRQVFCRSPSGGRRRSSILHDLDLDVTQAQPAALPLPLLLVGICALGRPRRTAFEPAVPVV